MNAGLKKQLDRLKKASYELQTTTHSARKKALKMIKQALKTQTSAILKANRRDLAKMPESNPLYDRLLLTEDRIKSMCSGIEAIISLPDPLHQIIEDRQTKNGLQLKKVSVPLGVIGVIYEARPNVTIDVSALCLKSGNAVMLRGSSSAIHSNQTLIRVVQDALKASELPEDSIQLLKPDRKLATEMMKADSHLDLIIPRGGRRLIQSVRQQATVPTIETGASVVHTFVDESADLSMAVNIVHNEKTRRPSVCNSLDTLLIHEAIAAEFLPLFAERMKESQTIIHADKLSGQTLKKTMDTDLLYTDANKHYDHEFLDLEMNVRVVKDLDEAIEHIRKYSLGHSESIVTKSKAHARQFQQEVDAACVYVNTSTAFSDGAQFEMGAEIGISTQKLHARGPMSIKELTSYKWLIESQGNIRP